MRIVFMGTPAFAVPTLQRLHAAGLAPVMVYSQPARPTGRGLRAMPPPVAQEAERLGLPLRQPDVLQRRAELERLADLAPDLILTVAYGKIFRRKLLALPRIGCLNLHPSLLPRYRGLSPIQMAILRGDRLTGVTLYRMEAEVDAGGIVAQQAVAIAAGETAGQLGQRLAALGAELTTRVIARYGRAPWTPLAQEAALASHAPRLTREQGRIDWRLPAPQIERLVRALHPWPGTFTYCRRTRVKIHEVRVVDEIPRRVPPGTILSAGREAPTVAALPGALALRTVQPENCRAQEGIAFCCGQHVEPGLRLHPHPAPTDGRDDD